LEQQFGLSSVGGSGGAKPLGPNFVRPYVVSWNLTYRCNLACEHCYLDAGGAPLVATENFTTRRSRTKWIADGSGPQACSCSS